MTQEMQTTVRDQSVSLPDGEHCVCVTGIWLINSGGDLSVLAEVDGQWRTVISEHIAALNQPVSHIVEPLGIVNSPIAAWLNEARS